MKNASGITAIELLIVLAIASLLLGCAVPGFSDLIEQQRVRIAAADFAHSLRFARQEAALRAQRISVANPESWQSGWTVFVDGNANGQRDAGETALFQHDALHAQVRVVAVATVRRYVSYLPGGQSRLASNAFQAGTVYFCPARSRSAGYEIVISRGGRARLAKLGAGAQPCQV